MDPRTVKRRIPCSAGNGTSVPWPSGRSPISTSAPSISHRFEAWPVLTEDSELSPLCLRTCQVRRPDNKVTTHMYCAALRKADSCTAITALFLPHQAPATLLSTDVSTRPVLAAIVSDVSTSRAFLKCGSECLFQCRKQVSPVGR